MMVLENITAAMHQLTITYGPHIGANHLLLCFTLHFPLNRMTINKLETNVVF